MQLTVKLFATLRHNRFKAKIKEFDQGITVEQAIKVLDIPEEEVSLIMVNGILVQKEYVLKDGDTLALFPPIGGG
ncbi:MAG: MoaD/ThiS family protein [Firmicutes bacterium]|nr:MoaD/ThiS family protein [Bacillota bacterium]